MTFSERKDALIGLGALLGKIAGQETPDPAFQQVQSRQPWFTLDSILQSIQAWSVALEQDAIPTWLSSYSDLNRLDRPKTIGIVNAGNIPLVGLHDLLCVFIAGHRYQAKNATEDPILLPWLVEEWKKLFPAIGRSIQFVERLSGCDAYIATGSNNSSRYFEYYFGRFPHIIRRNRNAVAILTGNETASQLEGLGKDIFTYYGLGCRNVAKLFVPAEYDLAHFFEAMYPFHRVMDHHKYMNNFDHHNAVYLLKGVPFLQNNFLILKEESEVIASPLAVVYYERYDDQKALMKKLSSNVEQLQCVVADVSWHPQLADKGMRPVGFGETQSPGLSDYPDGVDILTFLLSL